MRTCPACGEDTKAGYSEACTKCGFSAMGEQPAEESPAPEPEAEVTVGDQPPPPTGAPQEAPDEAPAEPPAEKKKRSPVRWVIWLVVIAGFFGLNQFGVFDEPTGPTADEVEEAIEARAPAGVTVECPDDAEDTPVDGTFTCVATGANGRTAEILVTNHEDNYEWNTGPLTTLG